MNLLIYAENGVGLGHIVRTINLANRLKSSNKNLNVLFITHSKFTKVFKLNNYRVIRVPEFVRGCNDKFDRAVLPIIKDFKPEVFMVDGYFSPGTLNSSILANTRKILILRKPINSEIYTIKEGNYCRSFDLIAFPHTRREFLQYGIKKEFINSLDRRRFIFLGPIYPHSIKKKAFGNLKRKYKISHSTFNLLITFGGGGSNIDNKSINDFSNMIKALVNKLKQTKNINLILITGPFFKSESINPFPGIKVHKYEQYFFELLHLVDLVITPAGYNICNEIKLAGVPSILVPIKRYKESQYERAKLFKKPRIRDIVTNFNEERIFKSVLSKSKKQKTNSFLNIHPIS